MVPSSSSSSSDKSKSDIDYQSSDEPCYTRPKYDVFLNYASEDIGKGFVSHLTAALKRQCFAISDHSNLPIGQDKSSELLKAIEDSEIHLVIFSPKYASSEACLDELVLIIIESFPKFFKRKVFPIFFDVDPSDVRNQQGSFLEAFQGYEKNVDPQRVQIWRQALTEAGDKSGLDLKTCRDEAKLIRTIMKHVRKMKNPQQLCSIEHPVGIDSRAQDVISALRLSSIVAVLGFSGSGKTAVVKAVYDKISADFDVSCFLQDINSYIYRGPNWKVDLQKELISYLNGHDNSKVNHNVADTKIKNLIRGRKLFLVLDDVYTFEQLQALSIHSASFHCESRVIVTTRNSQSLSNLQHTSYNIKLLDKSESFELFTRLIGKGDPMDKLFVDEIVQCAGGIPLVLEVWSRHFTDYERKLWPSILETLKRIPHEDTQNKLRISYDSLPKKSQKFFLDMACFFYGMEKDLVMKVLQDEDFSPNVEIQNLFHKFLLINECWRVVCLHDVIREMGQEVVRQEDEDKPGKRTRLMGYRDVVRVLGDCSETDSVRSIHLQYKDLDQMEEAATIQLGAFKKMSNLRFIKLPHLNLQWSSSSNDDISACFSFKHLKYMEWWNFPCKSLDNIDMDNLVVIDLAFTKLEKLWEGIKILKKLKILIVSYSKSLTKTGSFIGLENLEKLVLEGCENLEELDSSIGCLKKLVELDLTDCKLLKRLPWKMISKLTSLEDINLQGCTSLREISNKVGSLKSLIRLDLSYCTNVRSIPNLPPNMEFLGVYCCESLEGLPSNISELQYLEVLMLNDCFKLRSKGFKQVAGVRNLQVLDMKNCSVSQVSNEIGNMVSLGILDLSENPFTSLPESFNNLSQLLNLEISDCSKLQLLPPLPTNLIYIDASYCKSLDVMPYDSMQNAYIFPSNPFKESSATSTKGLYIDLSGKKLPGWCTYWNSGNVLSFATPFQFHHGKLCGFILSATIDTANRYNPRVSPAIYNQTKGTRHQLPIQGFNSDSMMVMFYPLDDSTLVVEVDDVLEVKLDDKVTSCGLSLVYEDDVIDSRLVLKYIRKPTLSDDDSNDDDYDDDTDDDDYDDHTDDDDDFDDYDHDDIDNDDDDDDDDCNDLESIVLLKDARELTLSLFPLSSEIMAGNNITKLNDEDECSFLIQDEECTNYDFLRL